MNSINVDIAINRFYSYLPDGNDYFFAVHDLNFETKEQYEIRKFLIDESIIKDWGIYGKHIISKKGEEIVNVYGGIDKYLEHEQEVRAENIRLDKARHEKIYNDAKLSKWQAKTFWFVFIFGLIGGVYTIYSIIHSAIGESEEQKIERILERKLTEQEQKQKVSTYQTNIDTLSKDKIGEK